MGDGPRTVETARREALAFLARTLSDAGVSFFVVPTYIGESYRLGVMESQRQASVDALRAAGGGWKARRQGPGRPPAGKQSPAVPVADLADQAQPALVVFHPRTWPDSTYRIAADGGATLEFWTPTDEGWEAPLRDPVSGLIPPTGQSPAMVTVAGASYPTVTALTDKPWDDIDVPLDVVYTWVDGSDPDWAGRRDERLAAMGGPAALRRESYDEVRFADHGELRYSLRSLEQFLPWVRTVHLVTAGQRPDWLIDEHPRLHLVDHADILEPDALPTFNSLAIETGLHRIDGLSESYLYFNDDVFAGRPVTPRDYFVRPDLHKFYPQIRATLDPGPRTDDDPPFIAVDKNVRELLADRFGRRFSTLLAHTPHAQQRGLLEELEREFSDLIARTRRSPFRDGNDIAMATSLHHYYAFFSGRAVPAHMRYRGVKLSGDDLKERLRLVTQRRPQAFCLNDTPGDAGEPKRKTRIVGRFLERYFPEPSSFER